MINGKKICVVMPAYNAERTLRQTFEKIPMDIVDDVILTDDGSSDHTVELSKNLGIATYEHDRNKGYGANQKTCYSHALATGADVVVMLHPDYQYDPQLIPALARLVAEGVHEVVIGSRILVSCTLAGGMPLYKYVSNRFLTLVQNCLTQQNLSEYHTGYRVFSRRVLEELPLAENSDDFLFDNQMLLQALYFGLSVGEVSAPAKYDETSSSINFPRSVIYGLGCLWTGILYRLAKWGLTRPPIFRKDGRRIGDGSA